jgi:hypothetical protein
MEFVATSRMGSGVVTMCSPADKGEMGETYP